MEKASFIKINPADSVVVCLRAMKAGEKISVDGKEIILKQDTPAGHKVLIEDKKEGENIIKYGYPIGHAKQDLTAGDWVNENNLKTNLEGTLEYTYSPVDEKLSIAKEEMKLSEKYDYIVVNDDVDRAVREIINIIEMNRSEVL